jgi:hypothetical protein
MSAAIASSSATETKASTMYVKYLSFRKKAMGWLRVKRSLHNMPRFRPEFSKGVNTTKRAEPKSDMTDMLLHFRIEKAGNGYCDAYATSSLPDVASPLIWISERA